ncbi:MAG: glycosyltransferase family 39 protein, partial [Anaerolineae bacterium]|nr:glycosyltransferase family 39 protein [Anaerolineae bacterium]
MTRRGPSPDKPLLAILAVAAALRFYGLGASSLWTDEARVAIQSLRPVSEILARWPGGLEPPASYLLTHFILLFTDSEAALRLPSALASLVTIWLTYRLGLLLFSRQVGLLAAALLAVSPLEIRYAQEARYYTLFSALSLLSMLSFYSILSRRRGWLGYIGWTALAGWTQLFAGAVLATQVVMVGILALAQRLSGRDRLATGPIDRALLVRFIVAWCLLAALFLAWYGPVLWERAGAAPAPPATGVSPIKMGAGDASPGFGLSTIVWDVYYRTFKWFAVPSPLVDSRYMTLVGIPPAAQWPFRAAGALVLIGLVGSWRAHRERAWLLAFQVMLPLTALAFATERYGSALGIAVFAVRRMLFLLPLYWLLVALGLVVAGEWLVERAYPLSQTTGQSQKQDLPSPPAPLPLGEGSRPQPSPLRGEGRVRGELCLWLTFVNPTILTWLLAALCCGTIALSILPGYYRWRKDDWRGLAAFLQARVSAGETVLCCDSWQTDPLFEWAPLTLYLRE